MTVRRPKSCAAAPAGDPLYRMLTDAASRARRQGERAVLSSIEAILDARAENTVNELAQVIEKTRDGDRWPIIIC